MGHEGFYNSLLVAMGNVVSALLMYVLQAAWLCQRLIDQDYRQNHGSRLKPLVDCKTLSGPVEIVSEWTPSHKRATPKSRKVEGPARRHGEGKKRRYGHQETRAVTSPSEGRLNWSQPFLEGPDYHATTVEYVRGLNQNSTLRRAFSDINISSSSKFQSYDTNQNYLSNGNIDETRVAVTDQDFLRLIFTKGYVT